MNKTLVLLVSLFSQLAGYTQVYNDTMFYKSGMQRVCDIKYFDDKNVTYVYTTSKGATSENAVTTKQLKRYVVYDPTGVLVFDSALESDSSKAITVQPEEAYVRPDSMFVSSHLLSFNPISAVMLGLNVSYTYRFGKNKLLGIHIPLRLVSPLISQGNLAFYTGIGFTAFIVNNEKYSMTFDVTPSIYGFPLDSTAQSAFSVPFTIGFVRYFKPRFAIDGRIGCGPGFANGELLPFPLPAGHVGLCFMLGPKHQIQVR
ncbi:MAG: hypothetical protein IPM74_03280 [Crocinitomicaceae bacterium]|nr:hypothetical protein [Crocinitomicaceae bacterium]MBK8924938.1 hypothetical protein [Crocinitomicaceae bacterium]